MEPVQETAESFEIKQAVSKMICSCCSQEFVFAQGVTRCPVDGALLAPVMNDPFIGKLLLGKYEIESLLGSGGYAQVYLANHLDLARKVAIKMLGLHLVSDMDTVKRFENEAKVVGLLSHKNVVAIHDYGLLPQPFLVMEYIDGQTLDEYCDGKPLALKEALKIISQVCKAVDAAHQAKIIHRDLKPSNIMLVKEDNEILVKVLDFGVAKLTTEAMNSMSRLTQSGETMGSPPYMSPEQCLGRALDGRSDVYSLGCLIYQILSGKTPYGSGNPVELMHKHMMKAIPDINQEHPELGLPPGLSYVIQRAMAKEPDNRYQSTLELLDDLKDVAELSPKQFNQRIKSRRGLVKSGRDKFVYLAVAVLAVILSGGAFYLSTQSKLNEESPLSIVGKNDPALLDKLQRAERCMNEGAVQQAIVLGQEATNDCKESAQAFSILSAAQLAQALHISKNTKLVRTVPFDKVIANAEEASKLDPKLVLPYITRIRAYCRIGKYDEAVRDCRIMEKTIGVGPASKMMRALVLSEFGSAPDAQVILDELEALKLDESLARLFVEIKDGVKNKLSEKSRTK